MLITSVQNCRYVGWSVETFTNLKSRDVDLLSSSSWSSRAPRCPCRWTGSHGPKAPAPSPSLTRPRRSCSTTAPSRRTTTTTRLVRLRLRAPPLTTHPGPRVQPQLGRNNPPATTTTTHTHARTQPSYIARSVASPLFLVPSPFCPVLFIDCLSHTCGKVSQVRVDLVT